MPKKKKNHPSTKRLSSALYKKLAIELLKANVSKGYTLQQIYEQLNMLDSKAKKAVKEAVFALERRGMVYQVSKGCFTFQNQPVYVTGSVDYVNPNYAYIIAPTHQQGIWVHQKNLATALDKDQVKVMIIHLGRADKRPEGRVVEILKRGREQFVGRVELSSNFALVTPNSRRMHDSILVQKKHLKKANNHDKVIVQLDAWSASHKSLIGKVVKVLGEAGMHEVEMHSMMAEFGLPTHFPSEVLEELQNGPIRISPTEMKQRKDCRKIPTFTIDPEDAKDFDDALSFRKLPHGNYEIGIHIADVSHYVKEGSAVEKEAFKRGTSVYLVDRTIPMLPEKLSNELCSLKPHEDKLTFSVVLELDKHAQIKKEWVGTTIIHSDRRFTYEEAQEIIDLQQGDFCEELTLLNQLAQQLRVYRFKQGAVNFETTEVKFHLDKQGKPLAIAPQVRKDTHKLIEEFMLIANKRIAERVYHMKQGRESYPFVYRTHDYPDPEKVKDFFLFLKKLGYKAHPNNSTLVKILNEVIQAVEGKTEENMIQARAIRTMAKAMYTTEAKAHFALAFSHYTHFTSPIRRYPDLMVHRLLKCYLKGQFEADKSLCEAKCNHACTMERVAIEAERASIKYKQVEFMEGFKGQVLEGIIASVTEWGIYVAIVASQCEGMVRLTTIADDYYLLDEKNFRIIGKKTKKIYNLGDRVKVRVKACNIDKRTIDLVLVS